MATGRRRHRTALCLAGLESALGQSGDRCAPGRVEPYEEGWLAKVRDSISLADRGVQVSGSQRPNQSLRIRTAVSAEPVVPISAIEHFAYCPRQCALIHCDGVWSDNAHTVRGTHAHRRVDAGHHRRERGRTVLRAIPLWSEELGLSGRADAVEIEGDTVTPVEYKSGTRHGIAADLQVCAQALCLEEMLEVEIPHGWVWYGGPRRRIQVDFTPTLRREVRDAIRAIREQLLTADLPLAPHDSRCTECQLRNHCLPDLVSAPRRLSRYLSDVLFQCAT